MPIRNTTALLLFVITIAGLAAPAAADSSRFQIHPFLSNQSPTTPYTTNTFSAYLVDHQTKKFWQCFASYKNNAPTDVSTRCNALGAGKFPAATYTTSSFGDQTRFNSVLSHGIWLLNDATGDLAFCTLDPTFNCFEVKHP